jgi:hypothetical protein
MEVSGKLHDPAALGSWKELPVSKSRSGLYSEVQIVHHTGIWTPVPRLSNP